MYLKPKKIKINYVVVKQTFWKNCPKVFTLHIKKVSFIYNIFISHSVALKKVPPMARKLRVNLRGLLRYIIDLFMIFSI